MIGENENGNDGIGFGKMNSSLGTGGGGGGKGGEIACRERVPPLPKGYLGVGGP